MCLEISFALFQCRHLSVHLRKLCLALFEEPLRIEEIKNGRHKIRLTVAATEQTRKSRQKTKFSRSITDQQHTKHFSAL